MERIVPSIEFNAFEAFEIAEKIERNGAGFYRRAAELFDDPHISKMFRQLADWEKGHQQLFADMRNSLLPDAQAMAGLAVFGIKPDPAEELTGKESKAEIIAKAIEKEKDSIVYYTGLKGFVPTRAGKDKLDDIIAEEMRHIRILNQSLRQWQELDL
jgi:rubrerythrin